MAICDKCKRDVGVIIRYEELGMWLCEDDYNKEKKTATGKPY